MKPETVVGWHRAGFRLYWRWRSRSRAGRPRINEEVRNLIKRMAIENPAWGAPPIHGEIVKLGFAISERTVARYLRRMRRRRDPAKQWMAFLRNHRELTVAFDFFTVPTVTFRLLYCFFVIELGRRRILHFNVTLHPTADWIVQQLREALPEAPPYRYAIFDHDSKLAPRATVIFAGDEFAVPAQQCLRRDNRCYFRQHFSSESPGFGGQAATLVVGQAKPPAAELSPQDSVLLPQILDGMLLLLIHPSGNSYKQKAERVQRLRFLRRHFRGAVVMLDGDTAGQSATAAIMKRLSQMIKVEAIHLGLGVQPDQLASKEMNTALSGHLRLKRGQER